MARQMIYDMSTEFVYKALVNKALRKGRTKEEVDALIMWLTGHDMTQFDLTKSYREFFEQAPAMNEKASQIKGKICGVSIEAIADPLMKKIRWLDKLVDDLAKGKSVETIIMRL